MDSKRKRKLDDSDRSRSSDEEDKLSATVKLETDILATNDLLFNETRIDIRQRDFLIVFARELFPEHTNDAIFEHLKTLKYEAPIDTMVKISGQWHYLARDIVAYAQSDRMRYHFSGTSVRAHRWPPIIEYICNRVSMALGQPFNFVLINRYRLAN